MARGTTTVHRHVDTVVLMAALGLHPDEDLRNDARAVIASPRGYQPTVSFLALGELMVKAPAEYEAAEVDIAIERLKKWRRDGVLEVYALGPLDSHVFDHAKAMRDQDHMLTPCDALIIAAMIEDPDADALVTTDRFVTYDPVVKYVQAQDRRLDALDRPGPTRRPGGNARSSGKRRKS